MRTRWHFRLFVRSLAGALLAFGLVFAISALTDEGGLSLAVRLGRAAPMTPLAAALGVLAALAPLRSRGELVAFAALGQTPARTILPAIIGASLVAAIASIMLLLGWIDVHGFFPVVPKSIEIAWDGSSFIDKTSGARVLANGEFGDSVAGSKSLGVALPAFATSIAALASFVSAVALSAIAAHGKWVTPGRAAILFGAMTLLLVGFQASATSRISPAWTLVPAFALLVIASWAYRSLDAFFFATERDVVHPHSRRSG